jgi:D-serine dehydratase
MQRSGSAEVNCAQGVHGNCVGVLFGMAVLLHSEVCILLWHPMHGRNLHLGEERRERIRANEETVHAGIWMDELGARGFGT